MADVRAATETDPILLAHLTARSALLREKAINHAVADSISDEAARAAAGDLLKQLRAARIVTADIEADRGVWAFVTRAVTLVNVALFIGTVGVLATVVPVLLLFCGTVLAAIARAVANSLLLLWQYVLEPLARPAIFVAVSTVVQSAGDETLSADLRPVALLLAACLACASYIRTLAALARLVRLSSDDRSLALAYPPLLLLPLAGAARSPLLGFLAIGAAFGLLGFGIASTGWGYAIGFDSRDSLVRCASAGAAVLALQALVNSGMLGAAAVAAVAPFAAGLQCFGAPALFLALLIHAGPHSSSRAISRATLPVALLVGAVVGNLVPGMAATANVAYVFGYLHVLDLVAFSLSDNVVLAVFACSGCLLAGGWAAHARPELVSSLYTAAAAPTL